MSVPAQYIVYPLAQQTIRFGMVPLGQSGGTTPPPSAEQFTIGGFDLTETFVTNGTLFAGTVSYTINPLSKRTQ